jgi:hypothetical protein
MEECADVNPQEVGHRMREKMIVDVRNILDRNARQETGFEDMEIGR